jgi:hypothetical protein
MLEGLFSAIATTQVVPPASMPAYLTILKLKQTRVIYLKLDKTRKRLLLNLCFFVFFVVFKETKIAFTVSSGFRILMFFSVSYSDFESIIMSLCPWNILRGLQYRKRVWIRTLELYIIMFCTFR